MSSSGAIASRNNDNWRDIPMWELWKYWTKITRTAAGIRNPRRRSRDLQIGERKRENQPERDREYLEIENK